MRSLHLLPHTEAVDGIQRASLDLARGLVEAGDRVSMLPLAPGDNLEAWRQVAEVAPPTPAIAWSPRRPLSLLAAMRAARRLRLEADVVVAHRLDLVNGAALLAARAGAPLVFHAHNAPPPWLRWKDPLRVPGTRRVDRLIVASEFMRAEWASRVGGTPIEVVALPVDVEHFSLVSAARRQAARERLGLPPRRFVIAYVGRLEEAKGLHVLLRAGRELSEAGHEIAVLAQGAAGRSVGEAPKAAYRARCIAEAGSCPVTWLAAAPDVREAIAAADVCCVPSIWQEPSGLVVAEALASGTPVVASAVGGIPEQLPYLPQAELVPPDDAGAVGRALLRLRENPPSDAERLALREHIVAARRLPVIVRIYRSTLSETA